MSASQETKLFQGFGVYVLATNMFRLLRDLEENKKSDNFFDVLGGAEAFLRKAMAYRTQRTLSERDKYPHLECMALYHGLLPGIKAVLAEGETEESCIMRLTQTVVDLGREPLPSKEEREALSRAFEEIARTTLSGSD